MAASSRSKSIAAVSALVFIVGLATFHIDALGLLPIFVIIVSFLMLVVHGVLHLSGHEQGDVFSAYQHSTKAMAGALHLGMQGKTVDDKKREAHKRRGK